ncbi:MAG: sensor histidine kinase [Verrucomicrobiales bacterium]
MAWTLLLVVAGGRVEAALQMSGNPSSEFMVNFWRTEDGLPQNSVTSIVQTEDGYIWCGTRNGLVRFDGIRFTVFNRLNSPELISNDIRFLAAGEDGSLWIAFREPGICRRFRNRMERVAPENDGKIGEVQCLLGGPEGSLYIGATKGLFLLTSSGNLENPGAELLGSASVQALSIDKDGLLWIGTTKGLWKHKGGKTMPALPKGVSVKSLSMGPDGTLWIGGPSFGLLQITPGKETPRRVWPVSQITGLFRSLSGDIWMIKDKGMLDRLSVETGTTSTIDLGTRSIHCLFEDREGNLWIGTEDAGVAQARRKTIRLYEFAGGRGSQGVLSVTTGAKGQIWVAGETGQIFDWQRDQLEPLGNKVTAGMEPYFEAICSSRSGGLWAGSRFEGLFFWDGDKNSSFRKMGNSVGITALFEDTQERLWIASGREGILLKEGLNTRIIRSPDEGVFSEVTCFAQDLEGRIWIGTRRNGLAEWKDNATQWHRGASMLQDARIECLYSDMEGTLWIGTNRDLVARRNGRFFSITTQQGLYDDVIYQIVEDFRGNLWMGSNRGIFRVAKEELDDLFKNKIQRIYSSPYGIEEGLGSLEGVGGSQPSAAKGADGKLWFATRQGLAVVDPAKQPSAAAPPVLIEEITADDQPLRMNGTEEAVIVPSGYGQLQIRFTALTYVAPERTQFRYQLEGVDKDWVRADQTRTVSYSRIAPGEHRFRVIARHENGGWETPGATILMLVQPHYWETAWFRAIMAGSVAALVLLFLLDRASKQRQLAVLRQQITRDLHDDLGSNIGSIALLSEALQRPAAATSSQNLELLSEINQIARQTLEAMRDAVWFVNPEKDSSADLVDHLKKIAESMLKNTPHRFELMDEAASQKIPLILKRGIVLIYKETLHNIIRHSEATMVQVEIELSSGQFTFEVRDNGRGFDPDQVKSGHGLKNLRHRAESLGGKLTIRSSTGTGTQVRFQVKVS